MSKVIGIGAALVLVAGLAAAVTMPSRTLHHISQDDAAKQCKSRMATAEQVRNETSGDYHYYECYGSRDEIPAYQ